MKVLLRLLASLVLATSASAGLATDPVVFTAGDWSVRKSKDPMTDKVSCTALYLNRTDVQLSSDVLYFSPKGRGGVQGYAVRARWLPAIWSVSLLEC